MVHRERGGAQGVFVLRPPLPQRGVVCAGFPAEKELDGFDFGAIPRLNKKRILNLSRCVWVEGRENLVKLSQRRFMTPLPAVFRLEDLNAHLQSEIERDLGRTRARHQGRTIGELLAEGQERFLPLPPAPFETCVSQSTFASKQSLLRFDRNDYSVPVEYAHHQVLVKGFVDRVELLVGGKVVASHSRDYRSDRYVLDPRHFIRLLERKPGGIHNALPFKGEPWGEDFEVMRRELEYRYGGEGTKKFIRVLLLFDRFEVDAVREAVRVCVRRRAFSEDAVYGALLDRLTHRVHVLEMDGESYRLKAGRRAARITAKENDSPEEE